MTTHTDRIRQMAQEAGIDLDPHGGIARAYEVHLTRFAQLVAEDCARVMREEFAKMAPTIAQAAQEGESVTHVTEMCAAAVAFRVNARYSLKD